MLDIAIVGGGLCGLALANSLKAQNINFAVFEARPRLGGRIDTRIARANGLALDLGAAWFWPLHQPRIARLVQDLGLPFFPQHDTGTLLSQRDPEAKPEVVELEDLHGGAMRIEGGSGALIQALAGRLPAATLHTEHVLTRLVDRGDHVELSFRHGGATANVQARQVVLALPPRLVEEHLEMDPPLDGQLREVMRETPTWMASQAKVGVAFGDANGMGADGIDRAAFWRDDGLSGNAMARHPRAVLGEVHDACDAGGIRAGLSGFFALGPSVRSAFRLGFPLLVGGQLGQLFGARAQTGEVHVQDWAEEPYTCARLDLQPLEEHPAYANRLLAAPAWNGRLHFGATETAAYGGGYMEGALEAAGRLRKEILVTHAALSPAGSPCAS